ncbi:MAG TPA: hypothetical protein VM925_36275 [Labilithrix sp.]|nr:hypothetical protein [Labilithrix sp.]
MRSRSLGGALRLTVLVAVVIGGSTGAVGCASERDPINRVQANALPKRFFVGARLNDASDDPEFYARSMVVDVPFGESGGGLYTNGINATSKIKWSIEENNLVGRVSYERVGGTDGKGLTPKKDPLRDPSKPLAQNDGVVVYNFRIISQFDIRRAYNASTGEEQNVIEENTSDRPWYDREYIRVDFAKNLVTTAYDFDTLSLLGAIDGIKYTAMEFDVRNPDDENAPTYDIANGYLDITNKVFAEPQLVDIDGWKVPGCFLPNFIRGGTAPTGNCNPNEITIRHAFKRVTDTDYEPLDWDGHRFETYGAFTTERDGYARDYGLADKNWKRFISRYNIWERSHVYSNPEKMEGAAVCNIDSDCAAVGGITGIVHCDTYNQKCTLPYQNRKEKPIVWHYSDGSASEFFEATREAAEEWDVAMRSAVQTAKYAECMSFGNLVDGARSCSEQFPAVLDGNFADEEDAVFLVKEVQACRREATRAGKTDPIEECSGLADAISDQRGYTPSVRAIAKLPEMVILCHSPVDKLDPKVCGKTGTVARLGDLRFHLVTAVATPQAGSPWGIMTDANDPLTGEHVAASVNVWTQVHDTWARGLVDTFRYIGGELATNEITDGSYVNKWIEAARGLNGLGIAPVIGTDEVDKRVASIAGVSVDKLRALEAKKDKRRPMKGKITAQRRSPLENALIADLAHVAKTKASFDAPSTWAPIYEARMNQLRGTPGEAALVTAPMQELGRSALGRLDGPDVGASSTTSALFAASSPLRGLNPQRVKMLEHRLENALAARGACVMGFEALAPLGYAALADELQMKFGKFDPSQDDFTQLQRADRMKRWLARRAHYSVISHEMGHSFGLRHNFVSSSDSWNYRPQYWALRTNAKAVTAECPPDGSAAANGADCIGPRWLDKVTPNEQKNLIGMWAQSSTMDYAGEPTQDLLGLGAYDFGAARMFYGDAVAVYKDARFRVDANIGKIAQDHQNDFGGLLGFRYGSFSSPIHYSSLDKTVSLVESCGPVQPESFRPASWDEERDGKWSALLDGHIVTNEAGRPTRCTQPKVDFVQWDALRSSEDKTHTVDPGKRVRVPHAFASDNWVDLGNVAVFRHDNGADLYETMHFWQAQQEMNHIFASYRRGRRDFSLWGAFQRTLSRYHEKMRDAAKAIGLYVNLARETVVSYNSSGEDPEAFVADILKEVAVESAIASSIAFDQFAHVFSRPQPGEHGTVGSEDPGNGTTIARSWDGVAFGSTGTVPLLSVANGVTGGFGSISLGGRPIENALDRSKGRDYNTSYTLNVGSYYEKAYTAYLMTESADNFISSSRDDYVDPRFRSVSLADVFPDGFRRWLGNNLTNDEQIKGVYTMSTDGGTSIGPPALDDAGYAVLGTTQWWPKAGIETCLPKEDRLFCKDPFTAGTPTGAGGTVVDSQVGFEQQKFAIIFSLIYLPENARTNWLDQLRIYDVSKDGDPGFDNRIEFHDPDGKIYVAQTFGTEVLFGKTVQRGVGARVLEYANSLLAKAVTTEPVMRGDRQVGVKPKLTTAGNVEYLNGEAVVPSCAQSAYCQKVKDYTAIPKLMFEVEAQLGVNRFGGWLKGVY